MPVHGKQTRRQRASSPLVVARVVPSRNRLQWDKPSPAKLAKRSRVSRLIRDLQMRRVDRFAVLLERMHNSFDGTSCQQCSLCRIRLATGDEQVLDCVRQSLEQTAVPRGLLKNAVARGRSSPFSRQAKFQRSEPLPIFRTVAFSPSRYVTEIA